MPDGWCPEPERQQGDRAQQMTAAGKARRAAVGAAVSRPRMRANASKPTKATTAGLATLTRRFANAGTAAEIGYAVLREAILSNLLAPGTRLRADDLAKELGVSKTPVREALRKLQAEDLVVVGASNALIVKVITEKQLLEIYYTREALEGMAARLAAENAGQLDLTQLRAVLHDVEAALAKSDRGGVRNYTGELQLAVFKAAHNDFLYDLLKSLQEKIRNHRTTTISVPGRDEEVVRFCRDLLRAIEARDPDAAERIERTNRRRTLELRLKMMRNSTTTQ
ncbi:MAG: GntR family transcriptional regulator [Xanthobacteraceae bacterium]